MKMGTTFLKRFAWLAVLPVAALAGARDDYAWQWPLALASDDAGAYRVALDASVYRQLQSPLMEDVDVVNAEGAVVPASLFGAEEPLAQSAIAGDVPWFPLPYQDGPQPRDIAAISEIGSDGSLRRIELRGAASTQTASGSGWVIDASRLRGPIAALRLRWEAGQAPFDLSFRVTASDDLRSWRDVQDAGRLVDLKNNVGSIVQDRIPLDGVQAKYLRLAPLQRGQRVLKLTGVSVEMQPQASHPDWQWQELPGKRIEDKGQVYFEFELPGYFPMQQADVALQGNSSDEWTLESRNRAEDPWRRAAAPWVAFQVEGRNANRSPPQSLDQENRDHYWRLRASGNIGDAAPRLRLGYLPEVMVFLTRGKAPYALVAGSGRAWRVNEPLPRLIDAMRAQRGKEWQPATATLGQPQRLAGDAALAPAPVERDWKAWLLWVLLIGGALIVAGFAFSLLKKPPADR